MNDSSDPTQTDLAQQFDTLTNHCGFVELPQRSFVSIKGDDRRKFLHSFCTNEIKELADGEVCEAFVLNTKGKLLGHVHVAAFNDELLLTGHGDQAQTLINHLDMYVIREDVELSDQTVELASVFVCGNQSADLLSQLCGVPELNRVVESQAESIKFKVIQTELAGNGFLIICESSTIKKLKSALLNADVAECSVAALEIVRVAAKTPWFGIDADDSNLPQELQRDEIAISFDKGCYLGQETVARIDARGRVNQLLVGFKFAGEPADKTQPEIGEFSVDEKLAGKVTSIAQLPTTDSETGDVVAIGYVRRQFKEPGTQLGKWVVL